MAAELSYGQFPVRIATTTLNGYGYINPLCYCELFLTLPALLYNAWLPLRTCYQVYVFAVTLAASIFSYLCFARISGSRRGGVLGAALYTLSAYRLVCVYFRAAVGEYTAMSFLPLVLLGVYEIYACEKPRFAHWAPLAVGMAALVQCHLISTELTGAFLLVFCLLRLRQTLRPARLLAWCKAAALAFGLSAWFLLPFVSTTLSVDLQVNGDLVGKPQREGLTLMQLLNPFGPGFGGTSTGTSTDMSLTLGLTLLLGLALVVFCLFRRDRWPLSPALRTTAGLGVLAVFCRCSSSPGILWKAGWATPAANWPAPSSIRGVSSRWQRCCSAPPPCWPCAPYRPTAPRQPAWPHWRWPSASLWAPAFSRCSC